MFSYTALITRVIDADTLQATVSVCPTITATVNLRLLNINCPEKNTPEGLEAIAYVTQLLGTLPREFPITVTKADKYGRWLASIMLEDGTSLEEHLLHSKNAVPYMVSTKKTPPSIVIDLSGSPHA